MKVLPCKILVMTLTHPKSFKTISSVSKAVIFHSSCCNLTVRIRQMRILVPADRHFRPTRRQFQSIEKTDRAMSS